MALTERQEQIKGLLTQGKSADEIGKALGISSNAVYQQIRRMRQAGEKVGTQRATGTRRASGAAKRGRQSGRKRSTPRLEEAVAPSFAQVQIGRIKPPTPLQSVRNRRDEIKAEHKLAESEVAAAEKALATAKAAHQKVVERHKDELKQLDAAEKALAPAKPKASPAPRKRASRARSAGKTTPTPPTPAAEPQTPPQAVEVPAPAAA